MEKQVTGAEDQIMAWLTEAMEVLEETGKRCELTLYLPAPEDSPFLGQPAVRAGDDIFTVRPFETDDEDIFIFSVIRPGPGEGNEVSYTEWEFPWAGEEINGDELSRSLRIFDKACKKESFVADDEDIPEFFYDRPRLRGLYACLTEIGAEPEIKREEGGEYILIKDGEITLRLSYLRADDPEDWILILECGDENGNKKTFRIPECSGVRSPEEYGRLLEAAERLYNR